MIERGVFRESDDYNKSLSSLYKDIQKDDLDRYNDVRYILFYINREKIKIERFRRNYALAAWSFFRKTRLSREVSTFNYSIGRVNKACLTIGGNYICFFYDAVDEKMPPVHLSVLTRSFHKRLFDFDDEIGKELTFELKPTNIPRSLTMGIPVVQRDVFLNRLRLYSDFKDKPECHLGNHLIGRSYLEFRVNSKFTWNLFARQKFICSQFQEWLEGNYQYEEYEFADGNISVFPEATVDEVTTREIFHWLIDICGEEGVIGIKEEGV